MFCKARGLCGLFKYYLWLDVLNGQAVPRSIRHLGWNYELCPFCVPLIRDIFALASPLTSEMRRIISGSSAFSQSGLARNNTNTGQIREFHPWRHCLAIRVVRQPLTIAHKSHLCVASQSVLSLVSAAVAYEGYPGWWCLAGCTESGM